MDRGGAERWARPRGEIIDGSTAHGRASDDAGVDERRAASGRRDRGRRRSTRSSSSGSSRSSSSSASSSSSSSSSSSDDGRRRRGKRKSKKPSDKAKKSKRDKRKKGKRDKGSSKRASQRESHSPDRLFHDRRRLLPPVVAATRLQCVVRGHRVRKWSTPTIRRIRAQRKDLTAELWNMLEREVLESEVIPDLLIEIITSMDAAQFAPHPQWLQQQLLMSEIILGDVVATMAHDVVREASHELIKFYLATERLQAKEKGRGRGARRMDGDVDPLMIFTEEEVVDVVVELESERLAREIVKELAQDHLFRVGMSSVFNDMADDCIYEAASLAVIDTKQHHDFQALLHEVADDMSREVADAVMGDMDAEQDAKLTMRANDELSKLSNSIIDAAMLRHLADRISTQAEAMVERQHAKERADRMLFSLLIQAFICTLCMLAPKPARNKTPLLTQCEIAARSRHRERSELLSR